MKCPEGWVGCACSLLPTKYGARGPGGIKERTLVACGRVPGG